MAADLSSGTAPPTRSGSVWLLALVATLTMSVSYIDRQTLAVIAPSVTKAFAIDETHYGWLISAFSIAYLVFAPLSGSVVDRYGARWGMAIALFFWSIIAGLHAFAGSFAALFALRLLLGTAEAPSFPSAAQAIRRALPAAHRPLAIGLLFTGSSIGAVVAAKVAVNLEIAYGFRGAFVGTAVIGLLWLPVWILATRGHGLERGIAPAAAAPVPDSLGLVLRDPAVLRAVVAVMGCAPTLMFVLNWSAKYLTTVWAVPKGSMVRYLALAPLVFDVGAIGFGWVQSRRERTWTHPTGRLRPNRNGLLLLAMVFSASLVLAPLMPSPGLAIVLFALAAGGGAGIYTLATTDMLARVAPSRASRAGGMTAAAQSIANVVAAPLVGWTIDRTHGYSVALVGLGVVAIPACLAFVAWPGMSPQAEET